MQLIPLSQLKLSETHNVRKTGGDKGLEELIASIKSHGLLENLLVIQNANDNYEVIAGGRRFRALKILEEKHELPHSGDIPCEIVEPGIAEEVSLAENMVRTPMHPADQFEAWAKLVDSGMSAADIAARFGVSDNLVQQRLKLGRISPKLMQAYRNDELKLESLMAFTLTDSHDVQDELFESIKNSWAIQNPNSIRERLTTESVSGSDKFAKFVGVEAYKEAGGTIRRDLFCDEDSDGAYFDDPLLLQDLARNKLEQELDKIQDKWKWTEAVFEFDYHDRSQFQTIYPDFISEVPEELLTKQEELENQRREIDYSQDGAYEKAQEIRKKLQDIENELETYKGFTEEQYAMSGCVLSIGYNGELEITEGLVRPEDVKKPEEQPKQTISSNSPEDKKQQAFSNALIERLENYKLHSVKTALAKDYEAAFDSALYVMCCKTFGSGYYRHGWLKISFESHYYPSDLRVDDDTCVKIESKEEKIYKKLPLSWLNIDEPLEQFEAFCKLNEQQKQKLFAACVSMSLQPQLSNASKASPIFEAIAKRLNVDVAKDWRPTSDNFLNRITKAQLLEIGKEIFGDEWVTKHQKKPKGDVVSILHTAFNKPNKKQFSKEQLESLAKWLPEGMK